MTPSPHHIELRQLIRKLAGTPDGYGRANARGLPGFQYSAQHTSRMVEAGELVRVKVPGYFLRFVRTQAQAEALKARLSALTGKRIRKSEKSKGPRPLRVGPLRTLIEAAAKLPGGVSRLDVAPDPAQAGPFSKCVTRLIEHKLLYRGKVTGHPFRFFARLEDAEAWQAATAPRLRLYEKRPPRATKPKAIKPAAAPVIKPAARPAPTPLFNIQRKPYVPPVRVKAVIVYTDQTRYSSRAPMPDRFAVTAPFLRIGSPGFSMSV
jgi:hypothetical protein